MMTLKVCDSLKQPLFRSLFESWLGQTCECPFSVPGKRKVKIKRWKELFINGKLCEDREDWKKKLETHCGDVCVDPEEATEEQVQTVEWYRKKGNEQFTCQERMAEISVDLVLQVRAQMEDNKVHGPEDNVLIKLLPLETFYVVARCYQERLRQTGFPEETGR